MCLAGHRGSQPWQRRAVFTHRVVHRVDYTVCGYRSAKRKEPSQGMPRTFIRPPRWPWAPHMSLGARAMRRRRPRMPGWAVQKRVRRSRGRLQWQVLDERRRTVVSYRDCPLFCISIIVRGDKCHFGQRLWYFVNSALWQCCQNHSCHCVKKNVEKIFQSKCTKWTKNR